MINIDKRYLEETESIDYSNPIILEKVDELQKNSLSQIDYIENAYKFVRDEIPHSWDIRSEIVSRRASEVLVNKTGICWTKSCLLAALLRANGVPSGISYQYLTRADEDASEGYIIHALNTVFISGLNKWIRLDARGNKENVHADFSLEEERLAFPVRSHLGEIDFRDNNTDLDERLIRFPVRSHLGEIDFRDNNTDLDERLIRILLESRSILEVTADFRIQNYDR